MTLSPPQIGFDRFIALDWAAAALRARAASGTLDELDTLLDAAGLRAEARKKTRTVLNRLWLKPRAELADFADRAVNIFQADPGVPVVAFTWGIAIATYPFFGKVAELVGRLFALQGDCTLAEVRRRMSEIYGEREGTYRMTRRVLQSQEAWGVIERTKEEKRIVRAKPIAISNEQAVVWLIEAALRYVGKAVAVPALSQMAVLYPFALGQPLGYLVSKSRNLELRSDGGGSAYIGVRFRMIAN